MLKYLNYLNNLYLLKGDLTIIINKIIIFNKNKLITFDTLCLIN